MSPEKRNNFELVVFDLDGTLIKSHNTIYQSVICALNKLGINVYPDKSIFMKYIGHHFKEIFEATGTEVNDFEKYMKYYKDAYFEFIDSSEIYPGVINTLKELKESGIKVALLTTKLQDQADKIIDHFNLRNYFDEVAGRRNGVANKPSAEPLLRICDVFSMEPESVLMVGDTELDIRCGKNAGAGTCAVTYGYREETQLKMEEPNFIINNMNELTSLLKL